MVAIDGSSYSLAGGEIALKVAESFGAKVIAANVYDAQIHTRRFHEMETILPGQYREADSEEQLREVHNVWTNEGFLALSRKRLAPYMEIAKRAGYELEQINKQGRNYVEILRAAEEAQADLIIMGAAGLGAVDGQWGSTAARVLRMAPCDVLLARTKIADGQIVVGIDGSDEAVGALDKAAAWGKALAKEVVLGAVYDPFFHNRVLESLEEASSAYETSYHAQIYNAVEEHGDEAGQEAYAHAHAATAVAEDEGDQGHDQMVDEGLARLYQTFLDKANKSRTTSLTTQLLKGKPYQTLTDYANEIKADLITVGRNGLHKTEFSSIGSNAEGIARVAATNVLVTK
jgi:nucleotide-binding universal stress UspA family protein